MEIVDRLLNENSESSDENKIGRTTLKLWESCLTLRFMDFLNVL